MSKTQIVASTATITTIVNADGSGEPLAVLSDEQLPDFLAMLSMTPEQLMGREPHAGIKVHFHSDSLLIDDAPDEPPSAVDLIVEAVSKATPDEIAAAMIMLMCSNSSSVHVERDETRFANIVVGDIMPGIRCRVPYRDDVINTDAELVFPRLGVATVKRSGTG